MTRRDLAWIIGLTLLIERVTVYCRFGLGLESTGDTGGRLARGLPAGGWVHPADWPE